MWASMIAIVAVCLLIGLRVTSPRPDGALAATTEEPEAAAAPAKAPAAEPPAATTGEYLVNQPASTFELVSPLSEISGLSVAGDGESLWAVHDERGTLYRLGMKDGKVLAEVPFEPKGDYEAVEEVGAHVFVARSDGALLMIDPKDGKTNVLNFKAQLQKKCDVEGLGFQSKEHRLLLSCKSPTPETRKVDEKVFEVFAMDLGTKKLGDKAVYAVTAAAMDKFVADHPKQADLKKIKGKSFGPSGLAVHPRTGEIYIVSSMGEVLVVLDPSSGAIVRIQRLQRAIHPQPEGIAFSEDGTMFLSNEARGKTAVLHVISAPAANGT